MRDFSYAPALLLNRLQPEGRQCDQCGERYTQVVSAQRCTGSTMEDRADTRNILTKAAGFVCEGAVGIDDPGFVIEAHCSLMPLWNSRCLLCDSVGRSINSISIPSLVSNV